MILCELLKGERCVSELEEIVSLRQCQAITALSDLGVKV
ncbi:MAG: hypothetical protein ACLP4V_35110 [Methylocella sp.]